MKDNGADIRYLVFDIETVIDGDLVAKTCYPADGISGQEAIERLRTDRLTSSHSAFCPYTYHIPACLVVAKVRRDLTLDGLVALDQPQFRSEAITHDFWRGWNAYGRPTLVTFNGRSFDLPVLELACFRYGVSVPAWFSQSGRAFEQPRNRYNMDAHLDLLELLTNFGASRFAGGLNLAATLLARPGKIDIGGEEVQALFAQKRMDEIVDYCTCDVLDTYFLFLRSRVVVGEITLEQESNLVTDATERLEALARFNRGVAKYLRAMNDSSP